LPGVDCGARAFSASFPPVTAPAGIAAATSVEPYVCPGCHTPLGRDGDRLVCAGGHAFPIVDGLPRFVGDQGYSGSFGFQWKRHSAVQVDSHTGASLTRDRFFRGTGWPASLAGERVLEAGCGSGRFTEVLLSTGATVLSFDYSAAAEVTHRAFGDRATVCQASIYEMPYAPGSFDRVFCYGVIQHCPDPKRAFFELVKMLRPDGWLAVDVYDRRRMWLNARYRVRWLTRRMDKERLHRWCEIAVPLYMRLAPPLHPWNQLIVPLKDYRGALPGLSREQEIAWSVLDTFDMLSPAWDQPQYRWTIERWCREAGLVEATVRYGGNGIEVNARRPG
jgi:SAM-dependent methyltransferase